MTKQFAITQEVFDTLPDGVNAEIKDTLMAFDKVYVVYECGEYHASTCCCIKAHYAEDHKLIGVAYQDDFYSVDEYAQIFLEEFGYRKYYDPAYYKKRKAAEEGKTFIR